MTEEQLKTLLRTVKRYEQPPSEYFDQLLRDLHRRQRAELLRRPLWRIAVERVQTFFGEHSMSPVSYASAMATVVVVGVAAIGVAVPSKFEFHAPAASLAKNTPSQPRFTLQPSGQATASFSPQLPAAVFPTRETPPAQVPPRYIIDARPVLYDNPSTSF